MSGTGSMICEACGDPVGQDGERAPLCAPFEALCRDCADDHYEGALEGLRGKRMWRVCKDMPPERRAKYGRPRA
jgi:hypothetical protein